MSSALLPVKLWGVLEPNVQKIEMVLRELGLEFERVPVSYLEVKTPEYLAVNPNGRLPSLQDPNNGILLWETGAIIEYLVETYDKNQSISFAPGSNNAFLAKQWLFFQTSGQGPYYGQANWFKLYHPEKLQSAIDRYIAEINRVSGVLEGHLSKRAKQEGLQEPWLVGEHISFADIAFLVYQHGTTFLYTKAEHNPAHFPFVTAWVARMLERESLQGPMAALIASVKERFGTPESDSTAQLSIAATVRT